METIKGTCIANIKGFKATVFEFARVPNVGEMVECEMDGIETTLRISQIIHRPKGSVDVLLSR